MVPMNLVYALSAYPFGKLADKAANNRMLLAGLGVLMASDVVLAHAADWTVVVIGVALWGLHMGMTQGLLAAMVSHAAPAQLRGTAFGFFNLLSGLITVASSVIAGGLWDRGGAAATFYAGAIFAVIAMALLLVAPVPGAHARR